MILESNLIKQFQPRYNVLLRDDKSYPYIHLSAGDFPRLSLHRGAKREPGRYFGPYPNARAVYETLHLMQKVQFPQTRRIRRGNIDHHVMGLRTTGQNLHLEV